MIILSSCGGTKTIFKGNKIYQYVNNQGTGKNDQIIEYKVIEKIKTPIKDKPNNYELISVEESKIEKPGIDEEQSARQARLEAKLKTAKVASTAPVVTFLASWRIIFGALW